MEVITSLKEIGHSKNSIKHWDKYVKRYTKVVVFGLGYVGIPLLKQFKNAGMEVLGFDINEQRILDIQNNNTKIANTNDIKDCVSFSFEKVKEFSKSKRIFYIVCVPTLVKEENSNFKDDYSALEYSLDLISKLYSWMKDDIVIIESTVAVGKTEELCKKRFKFYGFSPERISPSDKEDISKISKLLSTNNEKIDKFVFSLYKKIINNLYLIRDKNSIKIAEASKLLENTQRDVNIALMNEYQRFCNFKGISINDVLKVANTKWNFSPYKPGLVGGQCIGVDPYYVINSNYGSEIIVKAREINENKKYEIMEFIKRITDNYNKDEIILLGKTYKPNCASLENSGAFFICKQMDFASYDPLIDIELVPFQNKKVHVLLVPQKEFIDYYEKTGRRLKNIIMIDPFGVLNYLSNKFGMYYSL